MSVTFLCPKTHLWSAILGGLSTNRGNLVMTNHIPRFVRDTKKVLSTRWSAASLHAPAWAVNAIIYITVLRSLSYGLELFIMGSASAINPLIGFIALMGVSTWGLLMVISVVVLLIGLWSRSSIVVTVGSLLCGAVWAGFSGLLIIGWIDTGTGGRFAVAAISTAVTWAIFFILQLKTLTRNGVES